MKRGTVKNPILFARYKKIHEKQYQKKQRKKQLHNNTKTYRTEWGRNDFWKE